MLTLSADEAKIWLEREVGHLVYLHVENNPIGYLRNIAVKLQSAHVHGDGLYRIYITWGNPDGLLQFNDITHFYNDHETLVCTAYDTQSRISHSVEIRTSPFES